MTVIMAPQVVYLSSLLLLLLLLLLEIPHRHHVTAAPLAEASPSSDYTLKTDQPQPAPVRFPTLSKTLAPPPLSLAAVTSPPTSPEESRSEAQRLPGKTLEDNGKENAVENIDGDVDETDDETSPLEETKAVPPQQQAQKNPDDKEKEVIAKTLDEDVAKIFNESSLASETNFTTQQPKDTEKKKTAEAVGKDADADDDLGGSSPEFTWQTFVIIVITILIVLSNCAIIMVVAWTEAFSNFNKIFIYSLALADLLIGLSITPYSIFLSVYRTWVFESDVFCSIEAYMFTTLISAKMYSLTWLNVDQYVAVRKPERYNSMMTPARSLCWICFSWVVVISFCCPPLFSLEASIFDGASYICMIDTKQQIAYVMTAGALVCTPSIVTTVITGAYLFTKSFKKQIQFYEKVFVDLSSRPWNYHITFTMSVVFFGVWFPFTCVNIIIKYFLEVEMDKNLLFVLCWLGISTGFSQFIVLFVMSPDFRRALKELIRFPEFCRRSPGITESVATEYGIEARYTPPPSYLDFFDKRTSQDREGSEISSSPRSYTKGAGDRRKQSQRSGTYGSGSTSTGSLPFVDAMGSVTGIQYRGASSTGNSPARV